MTKFTNEQIEQIQSKGISIENVNKQLELFQNGLVPVRLNLPAVPKAGIEVFNELEIDCFINIYENEIHNISAIKFIPASGAASRMFKVLFEGRDELKKNLENQELTILKLPDLLNFFKELSKFPFFNDLSNLCLTKGLNIQVLLENNSYVQILDLILDESGLNYGTLPKGLLKFHSVDNQYRTPLQEHLIEASGYLKDQNDRVNIHFTVSPEHRLQFENLVKQLSDPIRELQTEPVVGFSEQKPETDTLAVKKDNKPFVTKNGSLLFRPGGHGALLENLHDLNQTVVFIGNIDNVAPNKLKPLRIRFKKLLGGVLLQRTKEIHTLLKSLDNGLSDAVREQVNKFIIEYFSNHYSEKLNLLKNETYISEAKKLLNKPVRVCGMVKNTGEPGGGPFWIYDKNGGFSKQIIERNQINESDLNQLDIFNSSTHFNPVDLVCYLNDYKGVKFDLHEFRDPEMAFISIKSYGGEEIKVMELPGLWNGAMAEWITFFVEVPNETFSPVKTVFDLLRPEHN